MRVLLVEDEPDVAETLSWGLAAEGVAETLSWGLAAEGYVVDTAVNGVDGL